MTSAHTTTSQAQVLEAYTVLHTLRNAWQGSLILNIGLDVPGAALSLASSVAGAVCLTLERDAEVLRAGLRRGACDFVVNTLDEALRAMKNEIRKQKPLAVGLEGDPGRVLDEMVERGVVPQLLCGFDSYPEQAALLQAWGALRLPGGSADPQSAAYALNSMVAEHHWTLRTFAFGSAVAVREFDERVLSTLPAGDELRRRWMGSAGRLFPRERSRAVWLADDEVVKLNTARGAGQAAG